MTVRDVLETAQCNYIEVCGSYKYGLTELYKGEISDLIQILQVHDILEKKNWGGIDEDNCFLLRDVRSLSGNEKGLWISVNMPDSYTDKDKNGNALDYFIQINKKEVIV